MEGAQGLDQPEALELASKTAADAAAQQDAAEQAAKAEAARQHAADAQAAQDEDRKRIAQVSVRAAGEFELGLNPLDSLTAQGACLMMRGAGGQPLLAPSSDRQVTTQEQRQHVRAAGWPPDVLQRLDAPDPPEPDPKHPRKRPPLPTGAGAAFGQVAYRLPATSPKEKGSLLFS